MGGNAFKTLLPHASFPRMHPTVYHALKAQLLPVLQSLYIHATVSPEAPGKVDFGDLDVIVASPRESLTHEEVKAALRATCSVPKEGNRTSNFAVPADAFEAVAEARRKVAVASLDDGDATGTDAHAEVFFQVDVNVCADHAQWERTVFYSSFSDLGFFLGLFAQTAGLSFSIFGMKLADPIPTYPAQTFYVSTSMDDILAFFGLTMDRWKPGFATEDDIFAWLATSPFAYPLFVRYRSAEYKTRDRVHERPMRQHFADYMRTHDVPVPAPEMALFAEEGNVEKKIGVALKFFGKDEEHATLIYVSRAQKRSKELLNGTNVMAWTGVEGMPIRFIMDEVKDRLASLPESPAMSRTVGAAVQPWQRVLLDMSDEDVRNLVVRVKEELAKDGRLEFDWKTAKAAKLEKKQQQKELSAASIEEQAVTPVDGA